MTLNTIPLHAGLFKTSRFVGLFAIVDSYSATTKADMHCYHQILKTLGNCSRYEAVASLMFEFHILEYK